MEVETKSTTSQSIDDNSFDNSQDIETTFSSESNDENVISGLSEKEIRNPNQVQVTISDTKSPIVIFFGPGKCGKTMTQIRLARYLHKMNYSVKPERNFRPSYDQNYKKLCDSYNTFVNNTNAAQGTDVLSFMLLSVSNSQGNKVCQLLEAPGEHYHDPNNPGKKFPAYIQNIINSNTRKIWVITLEPTWEPEANCQDYSLQLYVQKIKDLKKQLKKGRDSVILLYNKVDATSLVQSIGKVNDKQMLTEIDQHFPGLFNSFRNEHPISKLWRKYDIKVLPFSTGSYNSYSDGTEVGVTYTQSSDEYPKLLWNEIQKIIIGR